MYYSKADTLYRLCLLFVPSHYGKLIITLLIEILCDEMSFGIRLVFIV